MARLRGSAGMASRFSGHQYQRGYQFRNPVEDDVILGPWKSVWPLGARNVPQDALQALYDGVLIDGAVYANWSADVALGDAATTQVVGAFEFGLLDKTYHFLFKIVTDGVSTTELNLIYDDGTGSTTVKVDDIADFATVLHVTAVAWQDKLYFSFEGATQIYVFNSSAGTVAAVASTPEAIHLLIVDNNLCAIVLSGSSYIVQWAVDSDPTDWSGVGSGSSPIPGELGSPRGLLKYGSDAMIMCAKAAVQMSPTGTTPAFRFVTRWSVTGVMWPRACVSVGERLFYIGPDRGLLMYDGQEQPAGVGGRRYEHPVVMYHSTRSGLVFVSDPTATTAEMLLLHPRRGVWVGGKAIQPLWIADTPTANEEGAVVCYDADGTTYTLDLAPAAYTPPDIKTGRYYFGREVWIDYIDVIRTEPRTPLPMSMYVILEYLYKNSVTDDSKFFASVATAGVMDKGSYIRYFMNCPAVAIQIRLYGAGAITSSGPFENLLNAAGNVETDYTNPLLWNRADEDVALNYEDEPASTTFVGVNITPSGNLELLASKELWTKNAGIDRISIHFRETQPNV